MKTTTLILIILVTIFIVLVGGIYVIYRIRNTFTTPSGSQHAQIQIANETLEFDYPVYENWNISLNADQIRYQPQWMLTRTPTVIDIRSKDFLVAPDWSGTPVNQFGVHYKSTYSQVEFDDGASGSIVFEATLNSSAGTLPPGPIITMITETFHLTDTSQEAEGT